MFPPGILNRSKPVLDVAQYEIKHDMSDRTVTMVVLFQYGVERQRNRFGYSAYLRVLQRARLNLNFGGR